MRKIVGVQHSDDDGYVVCYSDNKNLYSYIQVWPGRLHGLPFDSTHIINLGSWCSINLKERVPLEEQPIYGDFVETLYFVPDRFLKNVDATQSLGFDYDGWSQVSLNGYPYPQCYTSYVEEYGTEEVKRLWADLVARTGERHRRWRSR